MRPFMLQLKPINRKSTQDKQMPNTDFDTDTNPLPYGRREQPMTAKERLLDFLKKTANADDKNYRFTMLADSEEADRYIHTMRTVLSQYRTAIRLDGKKLTKFKLRVISTTREGDFIRVHLLFDINVQAGRRVPSDVVEVLAEQTTEIQQLQPLKPVSE